MLCITTVQLRYNIKLLLRILEHLLQFKYLYLSNKDSEIPSEPVLQPCHHIFNLEEEKIYIGYVASLSHTLCLSSFA